MRLKKFRAAGAALAGVMLALVMTGPAFAVPTSGSYHLNPAPGASYGDTYWNVSGQVLEMQTALNAARSPSNYCLDNVFDWERGTPHYDPRTVRVCRGYAGRIGGYWASAGGEPGSTTFTTSNREGVCWGPDQNTNGNGLDDYYAHCRGHASGTGGLVADGVNLAFPNNCGAHWTRNNDNTTSFHGGGSPTSCSS